MRYVQQRAHVHHLVWVKGNATQDVTCWDTASPEEFATALRADALPNPRLAETADAMRAVLETVANDTMYRGYSMYIV